MLPGHIPPAAARTAWLGRLAPDQALDLAIGLPLRNRSALSNLLEQIYDPTHPNYRRYLAPAEFLERFGPDESAYQKLALFAAASGLTVRGTHANRLLLDVSGSVSDIEKAFQITLRTYQHPLEKRTFYAPDVEPSVDPGLEVLDISGLNNYDRPHPLSVMKASNQTAGARPSAGSGPSGNYMGYDFRGAYLPGVSLTGAGQVVGLVQFDGYYASDITAYETQAGLPNVPLQNVLLDGFNGVPTTGTSSGVGEVSLDIEMAISMAPGLSKVIVYEGGPNGIPNDVLNRMASDNLAKQLSCSWGWSGGPLSTTDQIFQQMAAQGQSFFLASGDSDAYPPGAIDNASLQNAPSDNPYATVVGGTTLTTSGPGGAWVAETVWNWGLQSGSYVGSSGGTSSSYSIPTWQQGLSMTANKGSTTKRNIPDVALTADNVWVLYGNGKSGSFGGTSCAAPLWAGLIALANQQATSVGNAPVGFVNPALYAIGKGANYNAGFHDITTGNNTNTSSANLYFAVAGYDLCTGWGTPNGSNLINTLAPIVNAPVIVANAYALLAESCGPANGVIDPGETVTVSFSLQNRGAVSTTNLVATLLSSNGVLAAGPPQSYGILVGTGSASSRPFTFAVSGACGGTATATLQLQDGLANLGAVSFTLPLGKFVTAQTLAQTFDAVTAPTLPAGWSTAATTGTSTPWVTTSAASAWAAPVTMFWRNSL